MGITPCAARRGTTPPIGWAGTAGGSTARPPGVASRPRATPATRPPVQAPAIAPSPPAVARHSAGTEDSPVPPARPSGTRPVCGYSGDHHGHPKLLAPGGIVRLV